MLSIRMDNDPFIDGSADYRAYRALATRAIADVAAGRPRASEHSIYASTYRNASAIAAVDRGELLISLGETIDDDGVPGLVVVWSPDEVAEFRSMDYLRAQVACGVRIETLTGEDVTHTVNWVQ